MIPLKKVLLNWKPEFLYLLIRIKNNMKTFTCNFGKNLSCTIHVSNTPPVQGKTHIQKFEWSRKPTMKVIRPYIAWINSVNQQLANEWGMKIMHVFQVKPGWSSDSLETWAYEPNGKPTLLIV